MLKTLLNRISGFSIKKEDPDILVKQIHNEIDSLEEKSILAVEKLLKNLDIPTEGKLNSKAKLMESLGFSSNNETILQSIKIIERIKESNKLKDLNSKKLHLINTYRLFYPLDKIVPFSEFKKVLDKYNLIYAPSKFYIKDVPEKNLIEIKNAGESKEYHRPHNIYYANNLKIDLNYRHTPSDGRKLENFIKNNIIVLEPEKRKRYYDHPVLTDDLDRTSTAPETSKISTLNYTREEFTVYSKPYSYEATNQIKTLIRDTLNLHTRNINTDIEEIDRSGLYIAAPGSHFDLDNITTIDGKEYFNKRKIKFQVTTDPIAFNLLRGVEEDNECFVRIISKWDTSDDQSYLDPIVQNENHN